MSGIYFCAHTFCMVDFLEKLGLLGDMLGRISGKIFVEGFAYIGRKLNFFEIFHS